MRARTSVDFSDSLNLPQLPPDIAEESDMNPYSREGEEGVIGCLLLDSARADEAAGVIGVSDFYDLRLANLFEAILKLRSDGKPVDAISLKAEAASEVGVLGGLAGVNRLADEVPSPINLPYYLKLVAEKSKARSLMRAARQIIQQIQSDNSAESIDNCEQIIQDFSKSHSTPNGGEVSIKDAVHSAMDNMESLLKSESQCVGVSTGFPVLDRMTTGMRPGDYWIIAARPSVGKTSLAMNIVEHVAVECCRPVGVLSMEMRADSLAERMVAGRAGVNTRYLREADVPKLSAAAAKIASAPIFIDETSFLKTSHMRAKARRMFSVNKIELLVVDYIQLGHAEADSRVQEVTRISNTLKGIAGELGIPVLALSQLNRGVEQADRTPRLSDLRDSGAIEQDADLVGLLHRPNPDDAIGRKRVELIIAKQRNGPCGIVDMDFCADQTRFTPHVPFAKKDD